MCSLSSVASAQLDLPPAPNVKPVEPTEVVSAIDNSEEDTSSVTLYFADPKNKIEELFNAFETEEKIGDKLYQRYLEDLRGFGLSSRPTALSALFSGHSKSVELAAEILEWVGDSSDTDQLVSAASVVADISAVSKCLDTAARLQQGQLPALAATLLDHPRRQVRTLIETRLTNSLSEDYLPKLLQFVAYGRDADLRLRAARLLSLYPDSADARQALRKALNDASVSVAFQSVNALVGQGTAAEIAAMHKEFLEAANDIEASYILFGLLQVQSDRSESVLSADLEPRMREMAQRRNVFISAVASACLAEQLFRSELTNSLSSLEQQVIFNLVRSVGGVDFYPQYSRFSQLAQGTLQRVTGKSMPGKPASAWVEWFQANQQSVQLVRGRIDIGPLDLPRLKVSLTNSNGDEKILCGKDASYAYGNRILGSAGQVQLLALLNEYSILRAALRPGDLGLETAPLNITISISLGEQRKVLRFRGSAGKPWLDELLKDFNSIYSATGWQTLATAGEGGLAFILQHLDDFDSAVLDPSTKGELFLKLSTGRMAILDAASLSSWLAELSQLPQRQQFWTPSLSLELYSIAQLHADSEDISQSCIELALTMVTPELLAPSLSAAMSQSEASREQTCVLVLSKYPLAQQQLALRDSRLVVRLAAVRSLSSLGTTAIPALELALADEALPVLHATLTALGELQAKQSLSAMVELASVEYDDATRAVALSAIANIEGIDVLQLMRESARDFSTSVRVSALNALSKIEGSAALDLLSELFADYAGTSLESSFQRAMFSRGAAACRSALRAYLLDANPVLMSRAAISLGQAGEPAAAPILLEQLINEPRSPEILNALVAATGADFRRTPDPAGTYAAWWSANSKYLPRDWLRNSLIDSGFEIDEFFDDPTRCSAQLAVTQLMKALTTGPARLRALCAYFIFNITNVDSQVVFDGTPGAELLRRVQPWQDWLNDVAQ